MIMEKKLDFRYVREYMGSGKFIEGLFENIVK